MGHLKVKFRIGRSHYNAALVRIRLRIDDNFYTPGGELVRVRVRIPVDDIFDARRGGNAVRVRDRISNRRQF